MLPVGHVYLLFNTITNMYYVGQTTRLTCNRLNEHFVEKSNRRLHNALRKQGIQVFKRDILCECYSIEELNEKEKLWILLLRSYLDREVGYNMTSGGCSYWEHPKETRVLIGNRCKQAWARRGKIYITNGKETRRISPTESIPDGWTTGRAPLSELAVKRIKSGVVVHHLIRKRANYKRVCFFCFKSFSWVGEGIGLFCSRSCSNKALGLLKLNRKTPVETMMLND